VAFGRDPRGRDSRLLPRGLPSGQRPAGASEASPDAAWGRAPRRATSPRIPGFQHLVNREAAIQLDMDDEITKETLITKDGEVVHERVRELNGLQPATAAAQGRND
jgi:hypothetical protein